jgi:hypothetical protein
MLQAKAALVAFVERGGLTTLKERLILWCKAKETEAGVLAILKVAKPWVDYCFVDT